MSRQPHRSWLLAGALMALGACGEGRDVPLTAPGGSDEWPADGRWQPVGHVFSGQNLRDAAWDRAAADDTQRVLVVGENATVFVHARGRWKREDSGLAVGATRVVHLGPDAFLVTGPDGLAATRIAGRWQQEDPGTTVDLFETTVRDGLAWVVGGSGTVTRRDGGIWSALPSPDPRDLVGVASLADTLLVVVADSDSLRAWDGTAWSVLAPGPWAGRPLRGVHGTADGRLVAAADSLYGRTAAGWRVLASYGFVGSAPISFKSAGTRLWFRVGADETDTRPPWLGLTWDGQTAAGLQHVDELLAVRDPDTIFKGGSRGDVTWVTAGVARADLAGRIQIDDAFAVGGGGLILYANAGLVWQRGHERELVTDWTALPDVRRWRLAGAGVSAADFWLVDAPGLYHVVNGIPERVADPPRETDGYTLALDGAGVPHVAADGVWRWEGGWERILPHGDTVIPYQAIWALGDGRLAARSDQGELALIADGRPMNLRTINRGETLLVADDGRLFAIDRVAEEFESNRNVLLVWDARGGAFREVGNSTMGPLARLHVDGWAGLQDLPLVWTRDPTMLFTLEGPPETADWRLVAGAWEHRIRRLSRLDDGRLLVLDSSDERLHLYRP